MENDVPAFTGLNYLYNNGMGGNRSMMTDIEIAKAASLLPITELAEKLGVKQSTVSSWEIGRSRPTFEQVIEISNIFTCSTDYLLGKADNDNNYVYTDNKTMQNFYVDFAQLSKAEQTFLVKAVKAYVQSQK